MSPKYTAVVVTIGLLIYLVVLSWQWEMIQEDIKQNNQTIQIEDAFNNK